MDFAAACKRTGIVEILRRRGAKGLCEKGDKGGFVAAGKIKGQQSKGTGKD